MLHAPAQVDGHVVVGIDGVNGQPLLLNTLDMIGGIVHLTVKIIIGKGATSDGILAVRLHHKADALHLVQQGVRVVGQLILQLVPVEGDHLIEVDLLAAGQGADLAALLRPLRAGQDGGAQLRIRCKRLLIVHGVAPAQPGIAGNGQTGQGFQQTNGPVPPIVFHVLLLQLPALGQGDGQLRPLQLVFRQFLRHIHLVSAHTHGDQGVVVPLTRGRYHADVHMNVRGTQLVEHSFKLAEILLDVPFNGLHFLLGVDLGSTGFLILGRVAGRLIGRFRVRVIFSFIFRAALRRFPGDFQGHLILGQRDSRAAGDGVLIICGKANGFSILELYVVFQHIGNKAGQEVPQLVGIGVGAQHFHLVLAEHIHAVSIAIHAVFVPVQAEPDPVEDGQLVLLQHIGKTLIEPGFKHHAAGVNAGGVFLTAAGGQHFGEQLAFLQQVFLFAQNRHHDVGAVLPGDLDRILPHIVVFCVGLGLAAGDRRGGQADGTQHIAHFKHQGIIVFFFAGVVFIHRDVPLLLHVPDELLLVPFSLGQQHKAGEDTFVVALALSLAPLVDLFLALLDHSRGILILGGQFRPPLGVGDGLFLLMVEILVSISHPHIPLGLVLAFLSDGFQHLDGAPQGFFCLVVRRLLLMVSQNGIVFQRPGQSVGGAIAAPVLRDGVQCLDAAGELVLVVPLFQLLEKCLLILRGVGDIVHARQRLVQLRDLILIIRFLLGRCFQVHGARLPAEGVEAGPGNIAVLKEGFGHLEGRLEVPGDEVHIAAEKAGGSASQSEHLGAVPGGKHFLQLLPEVKNLIRSFLLPQGIQRVAEEACHRAVGMEVIHKVVVGVQIAVDKGRTAGGTGDHIQSPVGVRVLVGFHLVAEVAVQIGFRVSGKIRSLFLQLVRQLGHGNGRLRLGFLQHIKAVYVSHMGNLAQHLVGEGGEHPPYPALRLLEHRQQLFTVDGEGETVFTLLLQPDLHILPGDVPAILGAQAGIRRGLTAHQDVPVLQHLLGGVFLEVDQLKQLDLVPLRGEDQLVLLAAHAHLERDFVKNLIQSPFHLGHDLCAAGMVLVVVHHLAQFCFHLGKGLPPVLCPLPEALRELRQGDTLLAPVDQFLNILFGVEFRIITGVQFQSFFKISQSAALLIQIEIGIAHAEIPGISISQFLLVWLHQLQCFSQQLSALLTSEIPQIVVGSRQLHIHFRGPLLGRNGLQRVDDLLVFALFMPLLALLQNVHSVFLLVFWFPVFDLLEHAIPVPLKGAGGGRM